MESPSLLQTSSYSTPMDDSRAPSLCIAVVGATGELARRKIFPALFALYYSGFLPKVQQLLLDFFFSFSTLELSFTCISETSLHMLILNKNDLKLHWTKSS